MKVLLGFFLVGLSFFASADDACEKIDNNATTDGALFDNTDNIITIKLLVNCPT